jgi:two-component system KDP operon response regulator KdpE
MFFFVRDRFRKFLNLLYSLLSSLCVNLESKRALARASQKGPAMAQNKKKILIIDSDPQLQRMMSILLAPDEYKIVECLTGQQALRLCVSTKPDLILLALTLPDMEGKDLITSLREWSQIPIIVLTERAGDNDVIMALNHGANDYVIRPFNADVLIARINVALRSAAVNETGTPEIKNGPLRIDLVKHQVFLNEEILGFTPKEYRLLRYFIVNCGRMLTHKEILKEVWGPAHGDDTQYLRVFIGQIRAKIEKDPVCPALITTEPGVGYRMELAKSASLAVPYEGIERRS